MNSSLDYYCGKQYGGCGPPGPCNNFIGARVYPAYLTRSSCPANQSCYYTGFNQDMQPASGAYGQASLKQSACLDSCTAFDDVYINMVRPLDNGSLLEDPSNVLSTNWNQIWDIRGPVACDESNCTGCPRHNFQGVYNTKPYSQLLKEVASLPGAGVPTRGMPSSADLKGVRIYTY